MAVIQLPAYAPDKIASVVAVEFEGKPEVQPAPSQGTKVIASSTADGTQTSFLTDGDPKNIWRAVKGEKSATLEIDLGKTVSVKCLSLVEPWHPWSGISQKMNLQYFDGQKVGGCNDGIYYSWIGCYTPIQTCSCTKIPTDHREWKRSPSIE